EYRAGAYWRADCSAALPGTDGPGTVTISVVHGDGYREIRWDRVQAFSVNGHIPPAAAIGLFDGAPGAISPSEADALALVPDGTMDVPIGA
ncbi:MAG TPA: hypothetical protein VJ932_02905, partial [Alkalispirochaeta sp.]|nr:hypothetical protein [Alkalispirochaeta sp.]